MMGFILNQIEVFDKNKNPLAVFSNDRSVKSDEAMMNNIANPIVNNVMNGESTLSFNILSSSEKWKEVNGIENEWHCDGRVYTLIDENNIGYDGDLVTATLPEIWNLLDKEFVQVHNTDTEVEAVDIHTVKILPKTDAKFKLKVNGTSYNDSDVKDSRGVIQPRGSGGYALWAILRGCRSGWTLGVCDVLAEGFSTSKDIGCYNLESDKDSILENVNHIKEMWGGVILWDSLNKIVHYRDETKVGSDFNTWNGFSVHIGKNLLEKPQIVVDNNIVTRAYPLGNGDIHVKDVNDGKMYVEDFSYTDTVYEAYIYNDNIHYTGNEDLSGQRQLLDWAKREIKKLSKQRISYIVTITDRREEERFSHEKFEISHIVECFLDKESIEKDQGLELRVIEYQYDAFNRSDCTIVLGDKILSNKEVFEMTYKNANVENVTKDWNGNISSEDIIINIPDALLEYFGGYGYGGYGSTFEQLIELIATKDTDNTSAISGLRIYADETFSTQEQFTAFQHWTENSFADSYTAITQVSDALSAQIALEAGHYRELTGDIKEVVSSVAGLNIYVDSTFATVESFTDFQRETEKEFSASSTRITQVSNALNSQITLEAKHYSEVKGSINSVSSSLASFRAEAYRNFATVSMLASTNNSLASVTATANNAYSSVNIVAARTSDINAGSSYIRTSSSQIYMGHSSGGRYAYGYFNATGSLGLSASNDISITAGDDVRINGDIYLNNNYIYFSNGYVRYS